MAEVIAGRYELIKLLGKGAMGVVYLAQDTRLRRQVAVKVMTSAGEMDQELRQRFELEARRAGALTHSNIITVFDAGEDSGRPYIVMELIEGRDLRELLYDAAPPPLTDLLEVYLQVCDGLAFAHQRGVIHRDLKPGNIRVGNDGRAKILDFGIARLIGGEASKHLTATGMVLGTPGYMSPEGILGGEVDHRSDIFSMGVILYEILTRHPPFDAPSVGATMMRVVQHEPDYTLEPLPSLPAVLVEGLQGALTKDVTQRFQDTAALASLVRAAQRELLAGQLELEDSFHAELAAGHVDRAERLLEQLAAGPINASRVVALRRERDAAVERKLRAKIKGEVAKAREYLASGEMDRAEPLLQRLSQAHPDHSSVQRVVAELSAELDRRRQAQRQEKVGARVRDANLALEQGNFTRAAAALGEALLIDPGSTQAIKFKTTLEQQQERREREERRKRAAELVVRGRELLAKDNLELAQQAYAEALEVWPELPDALAGLKELEQRREQLRRESAAREAPAARTIVWPAPVGEEPQAPVPLRRDGTSVTLDKTMVLPVGEIPPASKRYAQTKRPSVQPRVPSAVGQLAPRERDRARWYRLAGIAAVVAISIGAVSFWALRGNGPGPTPVGAVAIDASPWAEVRSIQRPDGKEIPLEQTWRTPCRLTLPAGNYTITLTNPKLGSTLRATDVKVPASGLARVHVDLPGFDVEKTLSMFRSSVSERTPPSR